MRVQASKWAGLVAVVVLASASAFADEGELVEKVAVRMNDKHDRLYEVKGRWELGANFGLTMVTQLTAHYNFNLSLGINLAEAFALELRGGYAFSSNTDLVNDVRNQSTKPMTVNDLSNMWRMSGNAIFGIRFQPIYGKINLVAEVAVHFQMYLWFGGGVGFFQRESAVICLSGTTTNGQFMADSGEKCSKWQSDAQVGPLFSAALGFRFFIADHHSVRLEIRDWAFIDSYITGAKRTDISPSNPTGGGMLQGGLTQVPTLDLGYSYIF